MTKCAVDGLVLLYVDVDEDTLKWLMDAATKHWQNEICLEYDV